jgi:hypothetical protein
MVNMSEWEKKWWWPISSYYTSICVAWQEKIIKVCSQINHYSIRDSGRCLRNTNHESFEPNTRNLHLVRATGHFRLFPRVYFCAAINLAAYSQTDRQPYGICRYVQQFKISIKYTSTSASFTTHEFNATSHKVFAAFLRLIRTTRRPRNLETWFRNHDTIARPVWSVQQFLRGDTAGFSPY